MSTIGSDGTRWRLEPGSQIAAQALARAAEMARALAAALQEARARSAEEIARAAQERPPASRENDPAAQETARVLVEATRLPAEGRDAFVAAAAGPSPSEAKPRAEAVREQIDQAFPPGSEARRSLGAALVSIGGGEPGGLDTDALETKVEDALAKLLAGAPAPAAAPTRPQSSDAMERARGFGVFGGPGALPAAMPAGPSYGIHELASGVATAALRALPEGWQPVVGQVQALAPALKPGIVSMARAESAVAAARGGLLGKGDGVWARAQAAAGDDVMGRIAARFEKVRDRLDGGLQGAATLRGSIRAESLATMARDVRSEATAVREDLAWTRELLPEDETGRAVSLEGAEGEIRSAEYGLEAFATQQDLVSGGDVAASDGEAPSSESSAGLITDEELARIGTGITEAPPAQGFWNVGTVGAGMDPAFSCEENCRRSNEAVNRVIGDATEVRPLEGAELAAAIRDMGVPLEKVDPQQLAAALGYINTGSSGAVAEFGRGAPQTVAEQKERLTLALRQFRCLSESGAAPMDRKLAIEVMWSAARIPGHAFEKMSDAEVRAAAQQVAAACNTPGKHEFKIGSHTVKLEIGESGSVDSTSTKAPSFWSRVGRVANVVLTVASFIPGPIGLAARCVQTGIALVNAIRNGGSFLDLLSAGASFVGAGAAVVGRVARGAAAVVRVAGNVARVANSVAGVARGVQGIQRGGVGGILSGAAGVASGIAGGIQGTGAAANSPLGRLATDVGNVGRQLGRMGAAVGAAEGYIHANRAVSEAREALERAQATGDPGQIRKAQEQLAEAERGKRSAVFGGLASVGQVAADTFARDSSGQEKPRPSEIGQQGRSSFQVGAEIFSRGMNAARGVNERDFLAAGAEAFGAAAAAHQGRGTIGQEAAMDEHGQPIRLKDKDGNDLGVQTREDFDLMNQASSVLDGLNNWRGADRGEGQARDAVDRAKQDLERAQASGNPEAIREAEANLRDARQGLVQADLGSTLALNNAAERFTGAVETFDNSRTADAYYRETIESVRGSSTETVKELERIVEGREAGGRSVSVAEQALIDLKKAQADLVAAEKGGDRGQILKATARLGDAESIALAARDQARQGALGLASLRERPSEAPRPTSPATAKPEGYRVRANDNPTVIAARITAERAARGLPGISAQDILEANGLTEASARTLQVGQTLVIPDETRHASLVITPAQLEQQRQGARDTRGGNVQVGAGESLERYAEMLGVKDKNAWIAEVRRRNPQLSADGRIYQGQVLDLPGGEGGAQFRIGSAGREIVPPRETGSPSPASTKPELLSPNDEAQRAQQRRFVAEDHLRAITSELDRWWEDTDAIEKRFAEMSPDELRDLRALASERGIDLQQSIVDNIQTTSDRDRLIAYLAGDRRAADNMGLRDAIEDARGGFFPPGTEDRRRVVERISAATDPAARAEAIRLLEEQAQQSEGQAANARRHGLDTTRDFEQQARMDQTWVEEARAVDRARSEAEARGAMAPFEFRRALERGDGTAMQRILDSVPDPEAFARRYAERYVPGILPSQLDEAGHFVAEQMRPHLSTQELDRARATLDGNTARSDAHRISAALDANLGIAPDFATIHEIRSTSTAAQWQLIQREVEALRGRSLASETQQMMSGVEGVGRSFFGTSDLIAANRMATGTYDVHAQIEHATVGLGTNDQLLLEALQSPAFQALSNDEKLRYREQLLGGAVPEVSGIDALRTDFALRGAPRTHQEALQRQRAISDLERSNLIHDSLSWLDESPVGRTLAMAFPTTAGLVAAGRGVEWYLSDQRERVDRGVAEVDRFLTQVGEGPLSSSQQLEYNRLMRELQQGTEEYTQRRDQLANYAGLAATTVVGVGATIASGGTLAPALLAFTAAGGAAANAGVRYAIRGSSTSYEDIGRDVATGAVDAGMTLVGGSLGNALRTRYVASRGGEAALSWTQRAGAGLVEGAPDGFIGGFAGGFTNTALADGTFTHGFGAGFSRSFQGGLEGAALGGVLGGAMGAGMSTAGGLLRRGAADGPTIGPHDVDVPARAWSEVDSELAPEFEPILLRRPKGVPDEQIERASYLEGPPGTVRIGDLPKRTQDEMFALAQRRQAGIERRDVLESREGAGRLTDDEALELTRVRADINEASRRLGETAADAYMARSFPGLRKVYPPPGAPSRAGDFDQVWAGVDAKGKWIVVEAKGGQSDLGGRWAADGEMWLEQGSPKYFNEIVNRMLRTDEGMEVAAALRKARRNGQVRYLHVQAPIGRRGVGAESLRDIEVNEFALRRSNTHMMARDPADVLAGGLPPAQAVPGPVGPSRTSGLFHRSSVTGDARMSPGAGGTNKYGDIIYSTQGSTTDQALALMHERLHSLLSPKLMLLREFRADLRIGAYENSQLVKYLEEALAETYAQLKVNGISSLPSGIRFPVANGYVELDRVLKEAAVATVTFGGMTYGVYFVASSVQEGDSATNRVP